MGSMMKPKVVTVVRGGSTRPRKKITILLNRRAVQTYEQLVADISEALGQPKWKNDHVRKLFTLKGREVKSVSDFFREDDCFIAIGRERINTSDIQEILHDLYPDSPYAESLIQRNLERNFRQQQKHQYSRRKHLKGSKSDSGLGESTEGETKCRVYAERKGFQNEERLKAKKWEKDRWLREQMEIGKARRSHEPGTRTIVKSSPETRFSLDSNKSRTKKHANSPVRNQLWESEKEEERRRKRLDEEEEKEREKLKREREAIQREKQKLLEDERLRKEMEESERIRRARDEEEKRKRREEEEKVKKKQLEEDRKKKMQEKLKREREAIQREKQKLLE